MDKPLTHEQLGELIAVHAHMINPVGHPYKWTPALAAERKLYAERLAKVIDAHILPKKR